MVSLRKLHPVNETTSIARGRWFGMVAALTIFVSAFLLFQVQPMESKLLLPWFGGSAAVWNTCVVFFQLALLAGYCYAHVVSGQTAKTQATIHVSLIVIAALIAIFTIIPHPSWKPTGGESASMRILLVLAVNVGLPFFLLSTTGPLIQAWFARYYPGRSPYRLYALSNVGSLVALASYPFFFERMFDLTTQAILWKVGFVVFGLLVGTMAVSMASTFGNQPIAHDPPPPQSEEAPPKPLADNTSKKKKKRGKGDAPAPTEAQTEDEISIFSLLAWVGLPWIASVASLAITGHLTEDVPTVPFMLIVPFTIYLLSFIICFDAERWYVRWFFITGVIVMALWIGVVEKTDAWDEGFQKAKSELVPSEWIDGVINRPVGILFHYPEQLFRENVLDEDGQVATNFKGEKETRPAWWLRAIRPHKFDAKNIDYDPVYQSIFYLTFLFFACMLCHGEVAALKPAPKHSTGYFLTIAVGGALGGLFVALVCPALVNFKFELPLSIVGSVAAACLAAAYALVGKMETSPWARALVATGGLVFFGAVIGLTLARYFNASTTWQLASIALGIIWGTALGVVLVSNVGENILKIVGFLSICGISAGLFGWTLKGVSTGADTRELDRVRGFFGVLEVRKYGNDRSLVHGRIQHGYQHAQGKLGSTDADLSQLPTTYYAENCGVGLAIRQHPNAGKMRVAVVGLGAGTTAAFAGKGETYHFYEIDPTMLAFSDKHFTYRSDAKARGADVEVKLGDARLTMERIEPQNYDVIAVDAFSGDSIPVHLLTEECMTNAYLRHLKPDGILAVHISNRYLDLEPVVRNLAEKNGMSVRSVHYTFPSDKLTWFPPEDPPSVGPNEVALGIPDKSLDENSSDWILVTKNEQFLSKSYVLIGEDSNGVLKREVLCDGEMSDERWQEKVNDEKKHVVAWTDRYSPLWEILSFRD